jgi:hypothetical protein
VRRHLTRTLPLCLLFGATGHAVAQEEDLPVLFTEYKRVREAPAGAVDVTRLEKVHNLRDVLAGNSLVIIERDPLLTTRSLQFAAHLRHDGTVQYSRGETQYTIMGHIFCTHTCWSFYKDGQGNYFSFKYFESHRNAQGVLIEKGYSELVRTVLWTWSLRQW